MAKMPGRERDLHLYNAALGGASLLDVAEDEFPDETSSQPCGPPTGHRARSYCLCLKRMYADA